MDGAEWEFVVGTNDSSPWEDTPDQFGAALNQFSGWGKASITMGSHLAFQSTLGGREFLLGELYIL